MCLPQREATETREQPPELQPSTPRGCALGCGTGGALAAQGTVQRLE